MGLKDNVKQRRHDKIRSLLDHYNEPDVSHQKSTNATPEIQTFNALDPELAWKRNPNPWAAWEEQEPMPAGRSYVKSQHTDLFHPPTNGWARLRKEITWKIVISLTLLGGVWTLFQLDHPMASKGQAFVSEVMKSEIDFASVALWYKDVFAGAPSFIPIFQDGSGYAALVDGEIRQAAVPPIEDAIVIRTFADLLNGVELAGDSGAQVVSIEKGRVIQVTEGRDSVLIQHANDRITIYGNLGGASVAVNQWVEAGQSIGRLLISEEKGQSLLYFAVKQNDRYMDPLDVIPID